MTGCPSNGSRNTQNHGSDVGAAAMQETSTACSIVLALTAASAACRQQHGQPVRRHHGSMNTGPIKACQAKSMLASATRGCSTYVHRCGSHCYSQNIKQNALMPCTPTNPQSCYMTAQQLLYSINSDITVHVQKMASEAPTLMDTDCQCRTPAATGNPPTPKHVPHQRTIKPRVSLPIWQTHCRSWRRAKA